MSCCLYCGRERALVKAHIIPEAFFRDIRGDASTLYLVNNEPRTYPKRSPIGVYDTQILCGDCEKTFQSVDDYAAALLIRDRDTAFVRRSLTGGTVYIAEQFDYHCLKLSIVSVLWRASVSTQQYFSRIDLGPRLARAKEMIAAGDPGPAGEFAVVFSRWVMPEQFPIPPTLMADPFEMRYDGIRAVRLYLGAFVADVSVEQRSLPHTLDAAILRPFSRLLVPTRNLATSKDLRVLSPALLYHGDRISQRH